MARVSYTECKAMYQERKWFVEGHNYTVPEKRCLTGKMLHVHKS